MTSLTDFRCAAVGVALIVALAACSSAPASTGIATPTTAPLSTAAIATATPTTTAAPTAVSSPSPIPDLIMTTGSATISVTNIGVATIENVAPLLPSAGSGTTLTTNDERITPDGVVDLTWEVLGPITTSGAEVITSLELTFKSDPSGTTKIDNNSGRVTLAIASMPVRATMYVSSSEYLWDTTAAGSGGNPAQADCTITSTRTATGGIKGSLTCAGTFFIPDVQAKPSFTAKATFWAEPA
jgi:hypothetical protein